MVELIRQSVGLLRVGGQDGNNHRMALKHQLMLGVIGAMLSVLLQGCTADKHPSQEESTLANAAKDIAIPLEAGKRRTRCLRPMSF